MGKKSREKKERKAPKAPQTAINAAGDLRLIEAHVDQHLKGVPEAETALRMLGRDAAVTVMQIAERKKNDTLLEFGRKLVAVKPQVETNLMELRVASVHEHVEKAMKKAPLASDSKDISISWPAIAVFDPIPLATEMAKGGRPRMTMERLGVGHIAWFAVGPDRNVAVSFSNDPPPADGSSLELRLKVESGIVFVGPPESTDGPRLGAVRLDPFRTSLDEHLKNGAFLKVKPGLYSVFARWSGDDAVQIHLLPAPSEEPLAIDKASLDLPAPQAAATA